MKADCNFDLNRASNRLSELDLRITADNLLIDVLWFRSMQCDSDTFIARHTHSTYEFHFAYSGSSLVQLDDREFTVKAGEFYVTGPGVFHQQVIHKGHAEFSINCQLSLQEEKQSEAAYILDFLQNVPCMPYQDTTGIMDLFLLALKEAYEQNIGFYGNIVSITTMIITAAIRSMGGSFQAKYQVPVKKKKNTFTYSQIEKFIQDNILTQISVADISNYVHLGEKQISRIVKEKKGISTKELIQELKFQKAKAMLLENSNYSIKQVAEALGFSSEYYFNQFFKRKEGYPPGIFRNNAKRG